MVPTREDVIAMINAMSDEDFKKIAIYVDAVKKEERVASADEVANITKKFNAKYEKAFRALSQ